MWALDWHGWHDEYDRQDSSLVRRLETVQSQVRVVLDGAPPGPLRVVSLCAGQGRDLLGVLAGHPRRDDVRARLVELDPRNAETARAKAAAAGLGRMEIVTGDASLTDHYQDGSGAEWCRAAHHVALKGALVGVEQRRRRLGTG